MLFPAITRVAEARKAEQHHGRGRGFVKGRNSRLATGPTRLVSLSPRYGVSLIAASPCRGLGSSPAHIHLPMLRESRSVGGLRAASTFPSPFQNSSQLSAGSSVKSPKSSSTSSSVSGRQVGLHFWHCKVSVGQRYIRPAISIAPGSRPNSAARSAFARSTRSRHPLRGAGRRGGGGNASGGTPKDAAV